LAERGISLRLDNDKIKADRPEAVADLLPDLKANRDIMLLLAEGKQPLGNGRYYDIRIACGDLLTDGMCRGCYGCEEWFPVTDSRNRVSGVCRSRRAKQEKEGLILK
jgi:hypothetical protein